MMGFFSDVFEKFLNVLAVIGLIGGTICGGIIGAGLHSPGVLVLGVIIGFLATFVFEIIFFGIISQIITIKNILEQVAIDTDEQERHFVIKELLEKQNNILQEMVNKA